MVNNKVAEWFTIAGTLAGALCCAGKYAKMKMPPQTAAELVLSIKRRRRPYTGRFCFHRMPGGRLFRKSTYFRTLRRKEGCRMSTAEIFTVIVALLALLVNVVFATFQITWSITQDRAKDQKDKKKK